MRYAAFGLSKAVGDMVASLAGDFRTKLSSSKTQHDLALQATAANVSSREALVAGLAHVCAVLYAPQSTVTDDQLRSIGSARPKVAQRVTNLMALPNGIDGGVLTFDRSQNPKSATFQILASADQGVTWTMVATSNRTKVTVPLAPGTPLWYRVVAQSAGGKSLPSLPVSVYGPSPAARALRLVKGGKAA